MPRAGIATLVIAAAICGAGPQLGCDRELVPSPRARHAARDDADARRLADQLAALPGVDRASVVVHRGFADPLAPAPTPPPASTASIVVVSAAAPAPLAGITRELAAAALPDVPAAGLHVVVAPPLAAPVVTSSVGPFEVAAGSRGPLKATLAIAFVIIAGLAGFIAYRERRVRARA